MSSARGDPPDEAATEVARQRASQAGLWRGVPRAQRVEDRRTRLIEAGLEVFGTVGARDATVAAVCARAQLTQRYFYESFPNMKALLAEVFMQVSDRQLAEMASAALGARERGGSLHDAAREALTSYYRGLRDDPRVARVQLLEILGGDGSTDRRYQAALGRAADLLLLVSDMREVPRPAVPRLLALGLIGAVVEIATMWLLSGFADPLDDVVASALVVFDAVLPAQFGEGTQAALTAAAAGPGVVPPAQGSGSG